MEMSGLISLLKIKPVVLVYAYRELFAMDRELWSIIVSGSVDIFAEQIAGKQGRYTPPFSAPTTMALRIQILQIQVVTQGDPLNKPYRDNGYVLLFQREGYLRLMVDHDLAELKGCSVYF